MFKFTYKLMFFFLYIEKRYIMHLNPSKNYFLYKFNLHIITYLYNYIYLNLTKFFYATINYIL